MGKETEIQGTLIYVRQEGKDTYTLLNGQMMASLALQAGVDIRVYNKDTGEVLRVKKGKYFPVEGRLLVEAYEVEIPAPS